MKLVAKYTLVFGATLAVVLAILGAIWVRYTRDELERDMRHDHRVIGRVLEASVADIWLDADGNSQRKRAAREITALLERSSETVGSTRFEWHPDDRDGVETQRIEGADFVSRFPITSGSTFIGTIVAREPLTELDAQVRTHAWFSAASIALIVVLGVLASRIMGGWLVGRPVALLVEQAHRIGRRELSGPLPFRRRDELGELAVEMRAASDALADSLAKAAAETEARLKAIEQVRHSDRLATVGKLAAGIAHELGTPLTIVGAHAQMIADREVTGDAALASARAIDLEVVRMGKIVRQLLDFARRKGPEGTACDPSEVAKRCASLLAVMAGRNGVRCEVRDAAPPPQALIDKDSLQQVLTNLMVNAIQAMPGGGTLAVAISRTQAAPEAAAPPKPCVRLDVSDTGGGIPPEVKAHMFEPFFTTKQPGDGTGLGLAVVHGIIVDHHGWITVETSERGTTFSLFLEEAPS
ncbi:MAG TPA: ATP-binding protein [Kofleriaceae bacterium]|nr:ATP-binding protein [Kofleriaceae bacterium]